MRYVSGGERRMPSQGDTGNHHVAQFTRVPFPMSQCHQIAGLLRGDCIKRNDPSLDLVDKGLFESLNQYRTSLSDGQNLQSEANLEDRN